MTEIHVDLIAGESRGRPVFEPVHVTKVEGDVYRVLYTPGLVYGIAADDEIQLLDEGGFRVVRRGSNLAVRVLSETPIAEHASNLIADVDHLGGRLDGQITRGLAFTIPVSVGFKAVESLFESFVSTHPTCVWEFGNVYDDDGKPIGWWPGGV